MPEKTFIALVVGGGKVLNSLTPWGLEVPNPPSRDKPTALDRGSPFGVI